MTAITTDTLNSVIEFDSPFTVAPGGNVFQPLFGIHAPHVEHVEHENIDISIDSDEWEAFSVGYTGQFGYNGTVMHTSETLSGGLAEDILSTPGTYVVTTVEVECEDGTCYMVCVDVDSESEAKELRTSQGCGCEPAGWIVLKLKEVS